MTIDEWLANLFKAAKVLRPSLIAPSMGFIHSCASELRQNGFTTDQARAAELWIKFGKWWDTKRVIVGSDFYPTPEQLLQFQPNHLVSAEKHRRIVRGLQKELAKREDQKTVEPISREFIDHATQIVDLSSENQRLRDELSILEQKNRSLEDKNEALKRRLKDCSETVTGSEPDISIQNPKPLQILPNPSKSFQVLPSSIEKFPSTVSNHLLHT